MYTLSCASMGQAQCGFVAQGETPQETVQKMQDHINASHPDVAKAMTQEQIDSMKDKVVQE